MSAEQFDSLWMLMFISALVNALLLSIIWGGQR